jgi:hypothetical protein
MVANHFMPHANNAGQSLLEVVLTLPLLFLFVALLYKIVMAEQMAINNVQYARNQLFVLAANSPEYPRLTFRNGNGFSKGTNQMVLGVADPSAIAAANANDTTIEPIPQIQNIARPGTTVKGSSDRGEVKLRTQIRVRDTVAICTQFNTIGSGLWTSETVKGLGAQRWPFKMAVCGYSGGGDGTAEVSN